MPVVLPPDQQYPARIEAGAVGNDGFLVVAEGSVAVRPALDVLDGTRVTATPVVSTPT